MRTAALLESSARCGRRGRGRADLSPALAAGTYGSSVPARLSEATLGRPLPGPGEEVPTPRAEGGQPGRCRAHGAFLHAVGPRGGSRSLCWAAAAGTARCERRCDGAASAPGAARPALASPWPSAGLFPVPAGRCAGWRWAPGRGAMCGHREPGLHAHGAVPPQLSCYAQQCVCPAQLSERCGCSWAPPAESAQHE